MLRNMLLVAWQASTLLRRDQITRAMVIAGLLITATAVLVSDWSVEEQYKVAFDVGYFGFQLVGSMMAIFLGSKSVTDSRQDGAIEWQLAAPLSRTSWLLGKYLGLALSLLGMAALLLVIWQIGLLVGGFGLLTAVQVWVFALMVLGWMVLLALAVCLGVLMRFSVALFASLGVWILGLVSAAVAATLRPETPATTRFVVNLIARIWDLQHFNLIDSLNATSAVLAAPFGTNGLYGASLVALFLTFASIAIQKGDINPG